MKNNFYVGIEIVIGIAFEACASIGCYLGCAIGDAHFFDDICLAIFLTIMLAVLPIVILIWCILAFAAKIRIDEKGITRSLFGIKKRIFLWEEIDHLKTKGDIVISTVIFYKKRGNKSFISHFSKYEVIYFYLDDMKRETLNFYAPDNIRWQIQKPLVHRH